LARNDVSNAHAVGELFRSATDLAVGCLGDQWRIAYGITGFVASFVTKVVLWLADGIKLVIDGLREAVESALYWRSYRIDLSYSASGASRITPYVGTWHQHGYTLTINSNLTGTLTGINFDATNTTPGPPDYRQKATLTFTAGATGITGRVDSVINPNSDPAGPFYLPWYKPGQQVTLRTGTQPGVLDFGGSHFCTDAAYQTGVCGA